MPGCRVRDEYGGECTNEIADPDTAAPQLCLPHALAGARLLEDIGALTLMLAQEEK
jgi:hypothetical protein